MLKDICFFIWNLLIILNNIHESIGIETISLLDESPINSKLLDLKILTPNTKMTYRLMISDLAFSYFIIKNDFLYTNKLIDMDTICDQVKECCNKNKENCEFNIGITCRENSQSEIIIKNIKIDIKDKNDNYPVFKDKTFEMELSESLKAGHTIPLPIAYDNDFGINRVETYAINQQDPRLFDQYFRLNIIKQSFPVKVELKLNKNLDRESVSKFSFDLLAIDGGYQDRKTGSINIIIKVIDENDNMPLFVKQNYKETIKEGFFSSLPILRVVATDPDDNDNGKILYQFDTNSKNDINIRDNFTINIDTGDIYLRRALNYEVQHSFKFVIMAINPTTPLITDVFTSSTTVEIIVENVYDELLEIKVDYLSDQHHSTIEENKKNEVVAIFTVKSKEVNTYRSSINCNLETYSDYLHLNQIQVDNSKVKTYEIRTFTEIDRETLPNIDTKIICQDSVDSNIKATSVPLHIIIKDQNDNAPSLTIIGDKVVRENSKIGKIVLTVKATDQDAEDNGRVTFSIEKSVPPTLEYLVIGESDGIIKVKTLIDCEANFGDLTHLSVIVTATDHGIPPRHTDFPFTINIIDENDNEPRFSINPMQFTIVENSPSNTSVGDIEVEDRDSNDEIKLELNNPFSGSLPFSIYRRNKRLFSLNTIRILDREKESKYKFHIIATDGRGRSAHTITGTVEIEVIDVNDNPPIIIFPPQNNASVHVISYMEPKSYKFMSVSANDQDQTKEYNEVEYQLEGMIDIFDIHRKLGYISTRREMKPSDIGDHLITITVSNTGMPQLKSSVTINIKIDKSLPKSIASPSDQLNLENSGHQASGSPGSPEIFVAILIVTIFFVAAVIIAFVLCALKHYNRDPLCLRPLFDKCLTTDNSHTENNKKNDIYKDQNQRQCLEKSSICREPSENWNLPNNLDPYNTAINTTMYMKPGYTKLFNPNQMFLPHHPYQTIDDTQRINKYQELSMPKPMLSMQNRGRYYKSENYKSEMNLNTENLFYEPNPEVSQINNEPHQSKWISSLTPMPTRSKSVISRVISNDTNDSNFAVVYPQEQSTFV